MENTVLKTNFCVVLLVVILLMAFSSHDVFDCSVCVMLVVIRGAFLSRFVSIQKQAINEEY